MNINILLRWNFNVLISGIVDTKSGEFGATSNWDKERYTAKAAFLPPKYNWLSGYWYPEEDSR